jgi:hypothetical protein
MKKEVIPPRVVIRNEEIKSIETWHIIDGKWRNIAQRYEDGIRKFYTDGILEEREG